MPHIPELKALARELRARGLEYSEISRQLGTPLPRATLEAWCADIETPLTFAQRQQRAEETQRAELAQLSLSISSNEEDMSVTAEKMHSTRTLLAALWMGSEEHSTDSPYLMFASQKSETIQLFLALLRQCYDIDERKFRVQVRCHVGLDAEMILSGWARIVDIPRSQFFKPLQNLEIDGSMCIVSYLSRAVRNDVASAAETLLVEATHSITQTPH